MRLSPQRCFAVLLCGLLFLSASCSHPGEAKTQRSEVASLPIVAAQKAGLANLSRTLSLTAEFIPYQEVDVMSKVAGFVKRINVDIGDRVKTGELIATLEVPEMTDDLTKAAATIARSDAQIKRARGEVERAQASHELSHLSFKRLDDVSKSRPGLVAEQELDDARTKDLAAEAQVAAAQSNLVAAQQESEVSKAEQARYQTLFNYSRVTAPFDGVVTMRYANTGSMIQAGTASQTQAMPLVRLSQNNLLRLLLPVPESGVPHVKLGEQVEVRVSALHRSFLGRVARFSDKVSTSTRTMETEVDVPNPSLILIPGMYAEVDLQLEHRANALAIPVSAVDVNAAEPRVYKIDAAGRIRILPVKLGLETANQVEVTQGLDPGDLVVVGDRAGLKEGDQVSPKLVQITTAQAES
jgi:RND family efflux transporter MFP subunit